MSTLRKLTIAAVLALTWAVALNASMADGLRAPKRPVATSKQLSPAEQKAAQAILAADKQAKAAKVASKAAQKAKRAARAEFAAAKASSRLVKAQKAAKAAAAKAQAALRASEEFQSCVDEFVGEHDEDEAIEHCTGTVTEVE